MTTEPSAAEHTAEDVELLATKLMGWFVDEGWAYEAHGDGEFAAFLPSATVKPTDAGEWWNPFVDANADVQVLERVREVWLAPAREWMEANTCGRPPKFLYLWSEFQRRLPASWEYVPGAFSKVALAVLREMEEG